MNARLRILFVDDESAILEGLCRLLRPLRDEWEVFTAPGGKEALILLESSTMDVVVTDMRMPGMDGAQLLEAVRAQHPHMVRIVLSGQSDQEALLRSVGPVHQYLSKPCDLRLLKQAVSRSYAVRVAIRDPAVADFAVGLPSLPSLPALYLEILACLRSTNPSVARIGDLVARDQGMSARVLQVVNSALFGLSRTIVSPAEAVAALGVEAVRILVLAVEVINRSDRAHHGGIDPERFWEHSLHVAHLAQAISVAEHQSPEQCTIAFTAGLMHDCGKLVLAHHHSLRYQELMRRKFSSHRLLEATEREIMGASHATIGAYLMSLWGLPEPLIESVLFHHHPSQCVENGFTPLAAVHIAEGFERCGMAVGAGPAEPDLDHAYLTRLGVVGRIGEWTRINMELRAKAGLS
jgi:HD-like signal output (HDOD) protein/CheY-like chemotaxis protein